MFLLHFLTGLTLIGYIKSSSDSAETFVDLIPANVMLQEIHPFPRLGFGLLLSFCWDTFFTCEWMNVSIN